MSRMIEVTKLQDGTYDVNPNAGGGGSPLDISIPGFNSWYGVILLLDNENNPLAIDNIETFDYSVVYTIFEPGDYSDNKYYRGTDFDELRFDESDSHLMLYKNGEAVSSVGFDGATSTSEFTIAHIIGL